MNGADIADRVPHEFLASLDLDFFVDRSHMFHPVKKNIRGSRHSKQRFNIDLQCASGPREFMTLASQRWCDASIAAGTDPADAHAAADRTTAAYTGTDS